MVFIGALPPRLPALLLQAPLHIGKGPPETIRERPPGAPAFELRLRPAAVHHLAPKRGFPRNPLEGNGLAGEADNHVDELPDADPLLPADVERPAEPAAGPPPEGAQGGCA